VTLNRDKPWHKNASNLLVVNSILAAIAALVIQTFVTDLVRHSVWWLVAGAASLLLFVLTAEKITEAFASDDVRVFVKYHLPYNIGVFLLLVDVVGLIRHYGHLTSYPTVAVSVLMFGGWMWGWGCDTLFLLVRDKSEFPRWIRQLEGDVVEPPIQDPCEKVWAWLGSRFRPRAVGSGVQPHANVYTRLRPSKIQGVGVFAIRDIREGARLFSGDDDEIVWVDEQEVTGLPKDLRKLYDDFAIIKDGKYGCPSSFNRLTMSWYLNDSDHPNVTVDGEYNMTAAHDIVTGEELTIDSSIFSAQPYKSEAED